MLEASCTVAVAVSSTKLSHCQRPGSLATLAPRASASISRIVLHTNSIPLSPSSSHFAAKLASHRQAAAASRRAAQPGRAFAILDILNRFTRPADTEQTPSTPPAPEMARKFIVGGNHKCNGTTESVKKLAEVLNASEVPGEDVVEVVISPPFVYLPLLKDILRKDFALAAQNSWVGKGGAYTGEVSAEMLVNLDIPWVILGHSERRNIIKETNEFVGDKVAYALGQGLKVIACVGEHLEQRESGETMDVVAAQLKAIADKVSSWENIVVAYEPVWAIGTGKTASPEQVEETHAEIRKWLSANVSPEVAASVRIQYGGSVNAANCKDLAALPDVDGFLVGGASLKPEFVDIINSATVSKSA